MTKYFDFEYNSKMTNYDIMTYYVIFQFRA